MIEAIDLVLRFTAIGLLLLFAAVLLRERWRAPTGFLGALFFFGVISYLLCPLVGMRWNLGLWGLPFYIGCFGVPVFFWLFSRAMFDDGFRLRPLHVLILAAVEAIGFWYAFGRPPHVMLAGVPGVAAVAPVLLIVPKLLSLAFIITALVQTFMGRAGDLIERRRRFRGMLVGLTGAYMVLIVAVEILIRDQPASPLTDLLNAGMIFALAFSFTFAALRLQPGIVGEVRRKPVPEEELGPVDGKLVGGLMAFVEVDAGHREPGLTIGRLAEKLGAQEHRLRRLINTRLGFRNFNEFLNRYRVKDACARLSDPAQARLPVLTIAMDLGYQSLGPFNRAFKEETGMTPSAYRRAKLPSSLPDNVVGSSDGRHQKT